MMTVEVETLVSTLAQYSPALWCGASYWTSACLSFLVCKIGAVIVTITGSPWRMECLAMNRTWACNQMLQQCCYYCYKWMDFLSLPASLNYGKKWKKNLRSGSGPPSCLNWDKSTYSSGLSPLLLEVVKQEKPMESLSPHVLWFWRCGYEFIREWI